MKQILFITTGGTIASKDFGQGLTPSMDSRALLSYVPETAAFCTIHTLQLLNIDSTNLQPKHWLLMAEAIEENYNAYDGFVISHGTDTLAYTAAALSYLVQNSAKPIVITGSQKPIDAPVTDAITNLSNSLRYAAHPLTHGVSVVFGGKVITGTRARKMYTKSYDAFASINHPYTAAIKEDRIIFFESTSDFTYEKTRFYHELNPSVGIFTLFPGADPKVLDYVFSVYDCVIINGFGVGGLPTYDTNDFYQVVKKWRNAGRIVIMATQVLYEGSDMVIYEIGRNLKQNFNLLEVCDMTMEAALTKMMWILAITKDEKEINRLFYTPVSHDIGLTPQRPVLG